MPSIPLSEPARQVSASRCVASLAWDQVYGPDPLPAGPNGAAPQPDATARWHDAVRRAGSVIANHPDFVPEAGRFRAALELARSRAVVLHADGTAEVRSGNTTYEIAPDCLCRDAARVSRYCKHYLAYLLVKEACCALQRPEHTPNGKEPRMHTDETPDDPRPGPEDDEDPMAAHDAAWQQMSEREQCPTGVPTPVQRHPNTGQVLPTPEPYAPSTLCLKARVGEIELSWTLRGDDEDVAARAQRVLAYVERLQQAKAPAAPAQASPATPLRACPVHGAAKVKPSTLFAGVFCTAKLVDGTYCKWSAKDN